MKTLMDVKDLIVRNYEEDRSEYLCHNLFFYYDNILCSTMTGEMR